MRILSFLLTILLTFSAFAQNVVLKSGKRISGVRIGEDAATIQFKDRDGTVLSIKKSIIDTVATDEANNTEVSSGATVEPVIQKRIARSIVDIAQESKKSRTGKAPLLTNTDLPKNDGVSVFGNTDATRTETETSVESRTPEQEERYWRKEATSLQRELSSLREKLLTAEARCNSARDKLAARLASPHRKAENLLILMETPSECRKLEEAERQMRDAETRLYNFEERARKSGVPWQWIE